MPTETYSLDARARQLFRRDRPVHLEPKVMDLLLYLVDNSERCVPREELEAKLWPGITVSAASLTRLAKELRRALTDGAALPPMLRTVRGRGYQFIGTDHFFNLRRPCAASPSVASLARRSDGELHVTPGLSPILSPVERAAAFGLPTILEGETGTGKECVARAVHGWSGRRGEIVVLRCAGHSESEFDAALAAAQDPDATLLLDEAGELPLPLQGRLLARLSGEDVSDRTCLARRTVVTSQRSLCERSRQGALRADLLARLDGITAQLPALRARREDIAVLSELFLERWQIEPARRPSADVQHELATHDWPFNVRELQMFLLRWLALSERA